MADLDNVREMALKLPDVEVSSTRGVTALKVRGTLLACPAINKSAEPGSLVVRVSIEDREDLIAGDPEVYYVTDHYVNYPSVLVRLSKIRTDALQGLLQMSWNYVTRKKGRARRP